MPTALITGSSSGFGRGVASALLSRGWTVYATMRDAEHRRELFADELEEHGDRLRLLSLDVTDAEQRAQVAGRIDEDGALDCLVNNAGYGLFGALEDLDEEQIRRQFEVNFFGAALLTRALLPALRRARGRVLNLSSILGEVGFPLTSAYCASKYALEGLSEALHYELGPHGVQVGLVAPGGHRTRFASSVEWARGDTGAYAEQTGAYRRMYERLKSRPDGTPPDAVVRTVVRLAGARRVPLRTVVGRDARALAALKALVPEPVRVPALGAVFSRAMSGGRS